MDRLYREGYLHLEAILPAPEDVTGYPGTRVSPPSVDPSPFSHPAKIAVLRVAWKDQAGAS